MYKTTNNNFYYLYQIESSGLTLKNRFDNYTDLIQFLARYQKARPHYIEKKLVYENPYLDYINMNCNDVCLEYIYPDTKKAFLRAYMFFDYNDSVVDARRFIDDILYQAELNSRKKHRYTLNDWRLRNAKDYEFRRTPIPYTSKSRRNSCRNVKIGRIIKDFKNPENKNFIRKKKYYDISEILYDYPFKNRSKCWKDQSKKQHQWEKRG